MVIPKKPEKERMKENCIKRTIIFFASTAYGRLKKTRRRCMEYDAPINGAQSRVRDPKIWGMRRYRFGLIHCVLYMQEQLYLAVTFRNIQLEMNCILIGCIRGKRYFSRLVGFVCTHKRSSPGYCETWLSCAYHIKQGHPKVAVFPISLPETERIKPPDQDTHVARSLIVWFGPFACSLPCPLGIRRRFVSVCIWGPIRFLQALALFTYGRIDG